MYVDQHDCLIQVEAYKHKGEDRLDFHSQRIYQRNNNCQKNITGNLSSNFHGVGSLTLNQFGNTFEVQLPYLIFGREIRNIRRPEGEIFKFYRTRISQKMYKFVSTYKHSYMESPTQDFIANLSVENTTGHRQPTNSSKPNQALPPENVNTYLQILDSSISAHRQVKAEPNSKVIAQNSSVKENSTHAALYQAMATGWTATIDNKKVEVLLWPNPKKKKSPSRVYVCSPA